MILWIKWIDSWGNPGWKYKTECHVDLVYCETVGFLVDETEDGIALALNKASKGEMTSPYGDLITIPKVAIIDRKECSINKKKHKRKK